MPVVGKAKDSQTQVWLLALVLVAACTKPLPGEGTAEAKVYRARCGTTCHAPVSPTTMPYTTWEMILPRMEQRIRTSRQPPMTAEERQAIESYLKKFAG